MGLSVHVIAPGFFQTQLTNYERIGNLVDRAWNETSENIRELYGPQYKERRKLSVVTVYTVMICI